MVSWRARATVGFCLAVLTGSITWAEPGGDDPGGKAMPPAAGEGTPPVKGPDDELGGGEKPSEPGDGTGAGMEPGKDDLGGGEMPPDSGEPPPVNPGTDELGGGEPKEPPAEPPAPPAEPPKPPPTEEPPAPPAEPPPAEPPADPNAPPAEPEPGSADAAAAAEAARKKEEDRVRVIVSDFERKMKKGTIDDQLKALTDISSTKHRLVAKALIPWIEPTVEEAVRDLAIEVAKGQQSPDVASAAASLFDKHSKNLKYARKMIGILGRSKDVKQVSKLRSILKGKEIDLDLQREAVIALGLIGHRDAIPDLIKLQKEFENPHLPPKDEPRKKALEKPVEDTLDLITGTHMPNAKGWEMWWKENEKTFQKTPPPDGEAPK